MKPSDYPAALKVAIEAAEHGAAELEAWRNKFTVKEKSRADLVTDADNASQAAVKKHLLAAFPEHRFLGEEDCFGQSIDAIRFSNDSPPTWVCDPLDGTANYAHDIPAYAVNIALMVNGEPVVGVTLDPRMNELFSATKGGGAFLNDTPIRVSTIPSIDRAMISTGFPGDWQKQLRNLAAWTRVSKTAQGLRRTGTTALNLAYVACGRFDGYWAYDNWPWDVLPGVLLVNEAGGQCTTADGAPFDPFRMDMIASNGRIHNEIAVSLRDES